MTDVITARQITIPANTAATSPIESQFSLGWSNVEQILIGFPPGAAALTGARVEYAENAVYPNSENSWFVFDDYILPIVVTNQEQGGQWSIKAYNTDFYAHTISVYFYWNYLTAAQQSAASSLVAL